MKAFFRNLSIVIVAVVAGFLIGRSTAPAPQQVVEEAKKEYAAPPTPPKMEVEEKMLVLETPIDGARIDGTTLDVSGRAQAGETPVHVLLKDPSGKTVSETDAAVVAATGSTFGRFQALITLDPAPSEPLTLEVSRAGLAEPAAVRVISFGSHEAVTLRAFFTREGYGADGVCDIVEPYSRVTTIGGGVYRAALEALLAGPSEAERAEKIATAFPKSASLRAVAADAEGVVTADFDMKAFASADACTRTAILSQVVATLRQFPEVRDVVLTIDGVRSELIP